jgi:two-component system chemotaxis response regulator CheY
MKRQPFDLVLINRKLDQDYSDGINVLRMIKADYDLANTPVMLITNHADHQQAAVTEGAEYGFGKLEFQEPATLEKLARFLR